MSFPPGEYFAALFCTLCIAKIQNELSDAREEITDKLFIKK
jgi:hypothetical protein